jgi:hypothetical protein
MLSSVPDVVNPGDTISLVLTEGPPLIYGDDRLGVTGVFVAAGDTGVSVDTAPDTLGAHTYYFAPWTSILGMIVNGTFVDDETHLVDDRGPVTGG